MEKKYPIGGYAPGNYRCLCCTCKLGFNGDKRAVQCEDCAVNDLREALKPYDQPPAEAERGAVWVKAADRLPGWGQYVRWRHESGKELPGKESVHSMTDTSPVSLLGFEWKDESAGEKDDWINVDDQLPTEGGRYWCYVMHQGDLGVSYFQWNCDYNDQLKRFSDMTLTRGEVVTHWRKLPDPPKRKETTI